jgi:MFS family permease
MQKIRWYDYITVNTYWLGQSVYAQTLTPLVFPLLVQQFVGEAYKGTFLGSLRLWTLMAALLVQALAGMLSDHSTLRWGRRRPFILIGGVGNILLIAVIALISSLEGMTGYWLLFAVAILLQVSSNVAHGAVQGLIPDLVPEELRGRFSGIKAVLEIPLPLILVAFTIGKLIGAGQMWAGILVAMGILLVCLILTMFVREKPLQEAPPWDWSAFLRLLLMTGVFTAIILAMGEGVKRLGPLVAGASSTTLLIVIMGTVGLLAIGLTVALGVWASVRLSIGRDSHRNPSFSWWVTNRLAFLVGTTNLSGFAVYFLQARLGFSEEKAAGPASQLMMFVGVMILLTAIPSGWLADRFGAKRLTALSGIVAALGTLVVLLSPSLPIIYGGGILIGAATGIFFTANWALGTALVPQEEAGRYLGISNLAGAGAGAVGAYIGGPIADFFTVHVPDVPGLGYVIIFAIYGVLFLLSSVALMRVGRSRKQETGG